MYPKTSLLLLAIALCTCAFAADNPPRVLYSNDTTHILSSPSPFKPDKGGSFNETILRASIDEAKGAHVAQLLQPGLGWVPWWKSEFLPIQKHVEFLQKRGAKPNRFEKFVLEGGDMIAVLIDECKKIGRPSFVSIRMNDTHHVMRGNRAKTPEEKEKKMAEFQLFADHPEARIGLSKTTKMEQHPYAMDWGNPTVREYKYKLIEEICKNYDFDGLELDFMRQWILFNPDRTTQKERMQIVTAFVKRIRQALDKYAPEGKHRWLCVRIPGYIDACEQSGFDLKALAEAGVDMFNMSSHYNTDFQLQVPEAKKIVGKDKYVYGEVHFAHAQGKKSPGGPPYLRRSTPIQLYTYANLVYARGGDGVSFFNFPYYRGTHSLTDVPGEPAEPPFEVLDHIGDPDWVSQQPQQYVLGTLRNSPRHQGRPLIKPFVIGKQETLILDMAPPKGGWQADAKLRIQGRESLKDTAFEVVFNGKKLAPTKDVSNPFGEPYSVATGQPDDYLAWTIPLKYLRDGQNTIELTQTKGKPAHIFYIDLSIPQKQTPPAQSAE